MFKGNRGLRTNRPKGVQWLTVEAILVRWHRKPKGPSRERAVERRSKTFARRSSRTDFVFDCNLLHLKPFVVAVGCLQPPSLYLRREDRYIEYLNQGDGAEGGNNSQIDNVTFARCPLPHLPQVKRRFGASPPR